MCLNFSTPELIRQQWQLKTIVFLHWCLICTVLLAIVFDPGMPFQLSVVQHSRVGSRPCRKHNTRLKWLARDEYSCSLCLFLSYKEEKVL